MAFYQEEIEQLNAQITRLISTIGTLHHAVSNLQDLAFDAQDDKHDPEYAPERKSNTIAEDSGTVLTIVRMEQTMLPVRGVTEDEEEEEKKRRQ
ncbi:hypothetical protein RHMOL_Rhmol04G0177200 [Rhododendron molle]|nr:hypothetical protein RHMOL_Rhmol04G0177200 [Rhododendron molle]